MHLRSIPPLGDQTTVSMAGWTEGRLPSAWLLLLAGTLAVSLLISTAQGWILALFIIIVLGVPHGALDGEVARPLLQPRLGLAWFPVFALPYLGLSALVLLAWHLAPLTTLAAFLAVSVWHFGEEDAGQGRWLERLVRGGLAIAAPTLLHPVATAQILGSVALTPLATLPLWLTAASWAWVGGLLLFLAQRPARRTLLEMAALGTVFLVLPPLAAFAFYFVGFHAPRHMAGLVGAPGRAPRLSTMRSAVLRSLPVTGLTLLLGAILWRSYPGTVPERLLALTLQGLAALTLPHLVLSHLPVERWAVRARSASR